MGKQSKRPAREARDVHAAIRTAAETLKASGRSGFRDAAEFPEIAALLHAAREAVAAGVPRFVFHRGRNYWLRVRLAAAFDIFAAPGDAEPLLIGASFSTDEHGHKPGH
ncbi:MAG: hypothetical protein J0L57_07975 [Burkholderiales bacterium]|nr:hypothetical protein [Burkholderiales bacterium]